jgi:hypothetical protein
MKEQKWLQDIIETSLVEDGFDGLCNPMLECGCFIGDLAPCDSPDLTGCCGGKRKATDDGDVCVVW